MFHLWFVRFGCVLLALPGCRTDGSGGQADDSAQILRGLPGLLGHSQPSTTLDIYTHAFDKNKQAASRVLQEGLEI